MIRETNFRALVPVFLAMATLLASGCTQPAAVVGIDPATGRELWRLEDGTRVLAAAGEILLVVRDDRFAAVDPATGKELWTTELEPSRTQKPFERGEAVVVACANGALALVAKKDGRVRWSRPLPKGTLVVAESDDGTLATLDAALDLTVFELKNGDARSKIHLNGLETGAVARMIANADVACLSTYAGDLILVDLESGNAQAIGDVWPGIAPCLAGGRVVAVKKDGSLAAIDVENGQEAWRIGALPAESSLAVESGVAWIGGQRGAVVGVEISSGEIRFGLPDAGTDASLLRDSTLAETSAGGLVVRQGVGVALVEPRKGRVVKSFEFTPRIESGLRLGDRAYLRAGDGRLVGVDLLAGSKLFESSPGSRADVSVIVAAAGVAAVL